MIGHECGECQILRVRSSQTLGAYGAGSGGAATDFGIDENMAKPGLDAFAEALALGGAR